jgi:hypothetical protein
MIPRFEWKKRPRNRNAAHCGDRGDPSIRVATTKSIQFREAIQNGLSRQRTTSRIADSGYGNCEGAAAS